MADVQFLAGDASFRKYYRIQLAKQSWVLMDAPPPENPRAFINVAKTLKDYGFSAPHIYASDMNAGFILLEDLGDLTFTKAFEQGHNEQMLYELAIDTLIQIHTRVNQKPAYLPPYTVDDLYAEAQLFIDWYYPAVYGQSVSSDITAEYKSLWKEALQTTLTCPSSLVLRDYHVDNLMVLPRSNIQACGLLDFQDARWGAMVYDVVSLLEDARRDIPNDLVEALWHRYLSAFLEHDAEDLRQAATILSAGRHAKIIGIFTRLARRDGKNHYLHHIPRVWRHLERCLEHPALGSLKDWFNTHTPNRQIP